MLLSKEERDQKASAEYLRSAQPRLICRVESEDDWRVDSEGRQRLKLTPYISEVERGWDEIISEGYDPYHNPLGCPVYWRVVKRGDKQFYCSTFLAMRDQVIKCWGTTALAYCDPITGMAFARIDTLLTDPAPSLEEKSGIRPAASPKKNGTFQ
jgi:hypothetical protein